jgi:hypothetical protein
MEEIYKKCIQYAPNYHNYFNLVFKKIYSQTSIFDAYKYRIMFYLALLTLIII